MYNFGFEPAKIVCISDILIDLISSTVPKALLLGNYEYIQKLVFKLQQTVQNMCFTYIFVLHISLTLIITILAGVFASQIIKGFGSSEYSYFQLLAFASVLSSSLYTFLQYSFKLEGKFNSQEGFAFALILVTSTSLYQIITKKITSVGLGAVFCVSLFISASVFHWQHFTDKSGVQFTLKFKLLFPIRPELFKLMLKHSLLALVEVLFEPSLAVIAIYGYSVYDFENRQFGGIGIIMFWIFRQIYFLSNSVSQSVASFLNIYFHSNTQINNSIRVYQAFSNCHWIVFGLSVLVAGLSQWVSQFIVSVLFNDKNLSTEQIELVSILKNQIKSAAALGLTGSGYSFITSLARAKNEFKIKGAMQLIQFLYLCAAILMIIFQKSVYDFYHIYLCGMLAQNISAYILYAIELKRLIKLREMIGVQVPLLEQDSEHETLEPQLVIAPLMQQMITSAEMQTSSAKTDNSKSESLQAVGQLIPPIMPDSMEFMQANNNPSNLLGATDSNIESSKPRKSSTSDKSKKINGIIAQIDAADSSQAFVMKQNSSQFLTQLFTEQNVNQSTVRKKKNWNSNSEK
ncbi:Conserved_hypothetical protein [Hexamita inflata]|uniref:Transmembrane protein n=1 Tax=Hexamita inflata TaxID=28002 RepID=A0AA86QUQ8_9EUKA|nr:Conserved hypothetical protein [Hexamita inflata]